MKYLKILVIVLFALGISVVVYMKSEKTVDDREIFFQKRIESWVIDKYSSSKGMVTVLFTNGEEVSFANVYDNSVGLDFISTAEFGDTLKKDADSFILTVSHGSSAEQRLNVEW
jgi:hypothetical protein